jgi:hypothetical protein
MCNRQGYRGLKLDEILTNSVLEVKGICYIKELHFS